MQEVPLHKTHEPEITLLNIDCMQFMATLPDKAFDLAVVDPPYGIGCAKTINIPNFKKGFIGNKIHETKTWDNERPSIKYFMELTRICENQIIWGGNYFTDYIRVSRGLIYWNKKTTKTQGSFFSDGELAWTSFDTVLKSFDYGWIGIDYINHTNKEKKIHPTQKPVALYNWILRNYAKPGQRILDTHLGSGSSAIAAHYFGCDFVGCEIDESYFLAAKERFDRETKQITLFGEEDGQQRCDKDGKDIGDYQNDLQY